MSEEEKRYRYSCENGEYMYTEGGKGKFLSVDDVLTVLNSVNSSESRVKELEGAISKALDNINCDASEAAMRPLTNLIEGK